MQKAISIFTLSAGALLLALASALFLINWTGPADLVQPRDPLFFMPLDELFWIIGGIAMVLALLCFFSERPTLPIMLLAWFAFNFWIYRLGLLAEGCRSLTGFLGGFPRALGISSQAATVMGDLFFASLLIGSCTALWLSRRLPQPVEYQKMSCPACGIHIRFDDRNLGQKIPCPQCQKTMTLRKPENLKMSCFFCQEHIEFPAHALGQKIKCPHCNNDVTLKEPA
jgi:predicted RNA-binding Zn-ribbon protein involved in translation (DUF1610 family)